jgi:hypothetical protein
MRYYDDVILWPKAPLDNVGKVTAGTMAAETGRQAESKGGGQPAAYGGRVSQAVHSMAPQDVSPKSLDCCSHFVKILCPPLNPS